MAVLVDLVQLPYNPALDEQRTQQQQYMAMKLNISDIEFCYKNFIDSAEL